MNRHLSTEKEENFSRKLSDAITVPTLLQKYGKDGHFEKINHVTISDSESLSTIPFTGSGEFSQLLLNGKDKLSQHKNFTGHFKILDLSKEVFEIVDFSIL